VIRLTSASGNDENSLEEPTKVYPTEQQLSPEDGVVEVTLPASSLNIIRMK
jgi:alpha-L-arabinofuranosidase